MRIPAAPLILGLAGVIPFVWGAGTYLSAGLADFGLQTFGPRFIAPFVLLNYGQIILAFMSGVLWGFATKSEGTKAAANYGLSVIPALWVFFTIGAGPSSSGIYLIAGFLGLLGLDYAFAQQGLTPVWWMKLRVLLTSIVVVCLAVLIT